MLVLPRFALSLLKWAITARCVSPGWDCAFQRNAQGDGSQHQRSQGTIRDSIKRAEQSSGYKIESAYIGVTGRHIKGQNEQGVVAVTRNDRLVRPDDLRRVLQNAQSIKIGSDQKILHMIPRHYGLDGQDGVQNPIGMHGFKLDAETHVITAGVSSVQDLVKCIRGVGVDVEDLVFEH